MGELEFYDKVKSWDFSDINCITRQKTNWNFYSKIKENSDKNSICLDLGTGGGEKLLQYYPTVKLIIGTDFSKGMLKTANENLKKAKKRNIRFVWMNNLQMKFPKELFDIISARHTAINAKQIYECLTKNGTVIIEGIDKKDCLELKQVFKRGLGYNDKMSISEKDYIDLKKAGFSKIEKEEIIQYEYYKTSEDLIKLLLRTPILNPNYENGQTLIEKDLFTKYVKEHQTKRGIELKRVLYGIVAKK